MLGQGRGVLPLLGVGAVAVACLLSPIPLVLSALGAVVPFILDTLGQGEGYVPAFGLHPRTHARVRTHMHMHAYAGDVEACRIVGVGGGREGLHGRFELFQILVEQTPPPSPTSPTSPPTHTHTYLSGPCCAPL